MPPKETQPARPTITVLHGPNLHRLGAREPSIYGTITLAELDARLAAVAGTCGVSVVCRQSNHEGELLDWIYEAEARSRGLVINPGAYTHTSIALGDALRAVAIPVVEVHLSNLYARDRARHVSHTAAACRGVVMGLGTEGYVLALRYLADEVLS